MSHPPIPPILASVIARITAAVPARARTTFLDLLLGAAAAKGGHVTDAILASGLSRGWSTYYWFLEQGRWSWLRIWAALLEVLTTLFSPAVWYVVIDDSVVERVTTAAPGSLMHHNHHAKPNRPKFLRGQGWLCRFCQSSRQRLVSLRLSGYTAAPFGWGVWECGVLDADRQQSPSDPTSPHTATAGSAAVHVASNS